MTAAVLILAPQLIRVLAPGLPADYVPQAITDSAHRLAFDRGGRNRRRSIPRCFTPTGASLRPRSTRRSLNVFTILGAVTLWKVVGHLRLRHRLHGRRVDPAGAWCIGRRARICGMSRCPPCEIHWREIVSKPASILLYSGLLALNITATRAYATHVGPGTAAALDYCMRCIGVPLTFLVQPDVEFAAAGDRAAAQPVPAVARPSGLIDRTLALAGLASVAACAIGVAVREPVIALLFQRGSFTADSTRLVSAVFLGFAPSLIGWSLLELTAPLAVRARSPVAAAGRLGYSGAVQSGVASWSMPQSAPEFIGLGASLGFLCAFALLFVAGARQAKPMADEELMVFLTGATGYMGRRLAAELLRPRPSRSPRWFARDRRRRAPAGLRGCDRRRAGRGELSRPAFPQAARSFTWWASRIPARPRRRSFGPSIWCRSAPRSPPRGWPRSGTSSTSASRIRRR